VANEPEAEQGPVLVTVEYRINPQRTAEFASAMLELGRVRRRDGAVDWGLYEDVAEQAVLTHAADPQSLVRTGLAKTWDSNC
jgi:hypothetical protein